MKPILIVKLGSTLPALAQSRGDFEDWIEARLDVPRGSSKFRISSGSSRIPKNSGGRGLGAALRNAPNSGEFGYAQLRRRGSVEVIDPELAPLPEPRHFSGAILTGSHSMVTDHEPWSERTAAWIPAVMAAGTPLLGICYGHQLIAYALGGDVGPNPRPRIRHRRDRAAGSGTRRPIVRGSARQNPRPHQPLPVRAEASARGHVACFQPPRSASRLRRGPDHLVRTIPSRIRLADGGRVHRRVRRPVARPRR